jgi:lipopolysaccharide biosynthesis glycosyltransferase
VPTAAVTGEYVYVVCSEGNDFFAEMAAVSLSSLRMVSPFASVTVLIDKQTASINSSAVSALRSSSSFKIIDCPGSDALARSRYLKTHLRKFVNGRFIFLDSDTIVLRSPDPIWEMDCDVAAVPDLSLSGKPLSSSEALPELFAKLEWTLRPGPYLNSGVIYFSDSAAAYEMGEVFCSAWFVFQKTTGKMNDQPAFNFAVSKVNPKLTVLPLSYNAQISMNAMTNRDAIIIHYFSGKFETSVETVAHVEAKRLKSHGTLDADLLQSAIASGNPWTKIDSYKKALAVRQYMKITDIAIARLKSRLGALPRIGS